MSKKIKVTKNGPYLVSGNVPLDKALIIGDADGIPTNWEFGQKYPAQENYSLCRCGKSKNKPYCDGTHIECKFSDGDKSLR